MKKPVKYILGILAIIVVGAWIYWQFNKKRIVKHAVENIITKKTDSLYYIHYDSSTIDAVNGSARFYNIVLQSDSLQKQLLQLDTASASSIYNIRVAEIAVSGVNIPALLNTDKVAAKSIKLIRPVIYIIHSGNKKDYRLSREDTLAVYEKLLGKFKSIKADEVIIEDGRLYFAEKIEAPNISLKSINVSIKNIVIDSTKNYDNIISYFIRDVVLKVGESNVFDEATNSTLTFTGLEYNAYQKELVLRNFNQKRNDNSRIDFDLSNTHITGLSTDSFILKKQLKAKELVSDGGIITLYRKKNQDSHDENIELDNNFFDEALLNKLTLKNTRVLIYNRNKPQEAPFVLSNLKFSASEIQNVYSGTNVKNLIARSNWILSADGFSFMSADKIYKISMGAFDISKVSGTVHIQYFSVKPNVTSEVFVKSLKVQKDLYDMNIKNVTITGVDMNKVITDKMLFAEQATLQPNINIFNDRTVAPNTESKVGNAPHQLFMKMKFPVYLKKIIVKNGTVKYTERGAASTQKGSVFFNSVNGTIENVTNIKARLAENNLMIWNFSSRFLGVSQLQSKWSLPLNSVHGDFSVVGYATGFDASVLNSLTEPLALTSIKEGTIKSINFNIYGNDLEAKGNTTLLYNNLNIEALKKDSNDLKKRDMLSFVANLILKDDNPKNGITRSGDINLERDKTRSFFNLIWKGIFSGVKRITLGKNDK